MVLRVHGPAQRAGGRVLGQAPQYLRADGPADGAGATAVAGCLDAFDTLDSYVGALLHGRAGSVTYEAAIAAADRITAFVGLPSDPYRQYLHP